MAGLGCITGAMLAKDELKGELKDAVQQRIESLGDKYDPALKPQIAIREITEERMREIAIQKAEIGRKIAIIRDNVEPRLTDTKQALRGAVSILDRDVTGRFNRLGNVTDRMNVHLGRATAAGGDAFARMRSSWTKALANIVSHPGTHPEPNGFSTVELVRAMLGLKTDNALAKELAPAIERFSNYLIDAYRQAGGLIGKLEHFVPHEWNTDKLLGVSRYEWVSYMLGNVEGTTTPVLDRGRIIDPLTDKPITEDALKQALEYSYDSISSDGLNKLVPGQFRGQPRLSHSRDISRFLHFTPEGYLDAMPRWMSDNVYSTMMHWGRGMARDTATMEMLGPNPNQMHAYISDRLRLANPGDKGRNDAKAFDNYWEVFTGRNDVPENLTIAQASATARSIATFIQLGSAAIRTTLLGDNFTSFARSFWNGSSYRYFVEEYVRAIRSGAINSAEHIAHMDAFDSLNWSMVHLIRTEGDTAWVSNTLNNVTKNVLDASGLERLYQAGRLASQAAFERSFVTQADKTLDQLPEKLSRTLSEYGISGDQWDLIRSNLHTVERRLIGPDQRVDYQALYGSGDPDKVAAATQFKQAMIGESRAAVFDSHLVARKQVASLQPKRGTIGGELVRGFTQYGRWGSTAFAQVMGPLLSDTSAITKGKYVAALFASGMMAGLISTQADQIFTGKEPLNFTTPDGDLDWRIFAAAAMKSGLLGWWGDIAARVAGLDDPYASDWEAGKLFQLSPVLGLGHDLFDKLAYEPVHIGNQQGAEAGFRNLAGAGLAELTKDFGSAFGMNLWFTKLAFDRLVLQNIERLADPIGYQQRQQRALQNMRSKKGQDYLWAPPGLGF